MNPSKIQKTDNAMSSKKSSTEPQNMILRRKLKVKEPEGNTVHDDDFNKGPWLSMLEHLSLPPFVGMFNLQSSTDQKTNIHLM